MSETNKELREALVELGWARERYAKAEGERDQLSLQLDRLTQERDGYRGALADAEAELNRTVLERDRYQQENKRLRAALRNFGRCRECGGRGKWNKYPCDACQGTGYPLEVREALEDKG